MRVLAVWAVFTVMMIMMMAAEGKSSFTYDQLHGDAHKCFCEV